MNHRQRNVLLLGLAAFFLSALCPPWTYQFEASYLPTQTYSQHHWLWNDPPTAEFFRGYRLDIGRLILEDLAIAAAVLIGFVSCGDKRAAGK